MWFFIILVLTCIPAVILSLTPDKNNDWQEVDIKAELLFPINEQEDVLKWFAKYVIDGEEFYIIVICSKEHQKGDMVCVDSAHTYHEYHVYNESNNDDA